MISLAHITRIPCGSGNCFCIEQDDSAILVDTCREQYRDQILLACKGKNIRLIVLTHGHVDHVQNAAALSAAFAAPIAMHRADLGLIRDNTEQPMVAHTLAGRYVLAGIRKSFDQDVIEPFEPRVFLEQGDSLDDFGIPATVVELPGHTKGSIGIQLDDGDLFVGDALMNLFFPAKSMLYGDRSTMLQSAAKISSLGPVTIHFGHGKSRPNKKW